MNEDIRGDAKKIQEITNFLFNEALVQYLKEHPSRQVDVFMAVHNFHVRVVKDIAPQWEPGIPKDVTFRMADMTFRKAMREAKRK